MDEKQLQEIEARIEKAHAMVSALCKSRGTEGTREWVMSIPAQPDYDPDLVIGAGLRGKSKLIVEVRRLLKIETAATEWSKIESRSDEAGTTTGILKDVKSTVAAAILDGTGPSETSQVENEALRDAGWGIFEEIE